MVNWIGHVYWLTLAVSYRFFDNRMLLLQYLLVSVKNNELFPLQDHCTITVTIFRHLFTIFTSVQPLFGSRYDYRTVFISHSTGYNFIQKYLYDFERWTHFWFLFSNFFTLLIASKRLKTVIRNTSNFSALPFDLSFSRFSFPDLNFWNGLLSSTESSPKTNLIFRYASLWPSLNSCRNLIRSKFVRFWKNG